MEPVSLDVKGTYVNLGDHNGVLVSTDMTERHDVHLVKLKETQVLNKTIGLSSWSIFGNWLPIYTIILIGWLFSRREN